MSLNSALLSREVALSKERRLRSIQQSDHEKHNETKDVKKLNFLLKQDVELIVE